MAEIFDISNQFMISKELSWENCIGLCTDGAKAMTGSRKATHCVLQREALASKELYPFSLRFYKEGNALCFTQRSTRIKRTVPVFAQILSDQNLNLATHSKDPAWNAKLAYLADVFDELNTLNTSMEGPQSCLYSYNNMAY